jgi:hypothetical protein
LFSGGACLPTAGLRNSAAQQCLCGKRFAWSYRCYEASGDVNMPEP